MKTLIITVEVRDDEDDPDVTPLKTRVQSLFDYGSIRDAFDVVGVTLIKTDVQEK